MSDIAEIEDIVEEMLDEPALRIVLTKVVQGTLTPMMAMKLLDNVKTLVMREMGIKIADDKKATE